MRISPQLSQILLRALDQTSQKEQTALTQLTTGRRVNLPSDDPAAAALEVSIASESGNVDQFLRSISSISSELQTADSSLSSVVTSLQRAIALGVEGANGTLSLQDRQSLATEVKEISSQVLNLANLAYNGKYLFAGTANSQPPYVQDNAGNISYVGNSGVNYVEVGSGQSIAANEPGNNLFSAPGADVFQALSDLATRLGDGVSSTTDIGNAVNEVRAAYDHLNSARTIYGSTVDELANSADFLSNEKVQLSAQQNDTVGVDVETAATNLANAEVARNAALQAASATSGASLLDYLYGSK